MGRYVFNERKLFLLKQWYANNANNDEEIGMSLLLFIRMLIGSMEAIIEENGMRDIYHLSHLMGAFHDNCRHFKDFPFKRGWALNES